MGQAEYYARMSAAGDDAELLGQLADELKELPDSWAGALRIKVIGRKLKASALRRRATGPLIARPAAEPGPIPDWLAPYGLPSPDGRPLHRYRLTNEAFRLLQEHLQRRAPSLQFHASTSDAALFVLWAAEWFRRCYDGKGQEWRRLGVPIGLTRDQAGWRNLADAGLKRWGLSELRISGVHHRLAAIARQGGFPLAAIEGTGAGWAPKYLERLVGVLLNESDSTLENAIGIASSLIGLVPETWRNEEMQVVCAELALEVVRLRRLAETEGVLAGSLVSVWLDQHHPDWRDDLPLSVDSEAGKVLIDGLMKAVPLKGGAGSVQAKRLLLIEAGVRRERVILKLEGTLNDASGKAIAKNLAGDWSRLRLFPSGQFAHHFSGELAIADPDDEGTWIARPAGSRTDFDLPFGVPVIAELRGDGQRIGQPFILSGGDRISNGLRICVGLSDHGETPTKFEVIGGGSGGYRADCLYLDMPSTWQAAPRSEETRCIEVDDARADGRSMWELRGAATITTDGGDCYLVRTGQTGDQRDVLSLIGDVPSGCVNLDEATRLFSGSPRLEVQEGRHRRAPSVDEAWWRRQGDRQWRAYDGDAGPGSCEFAWRAAQTNHLRDRQEAIVLPADFRIEKRRVGDWIDLAIEGWPGRAEFEGGRQLDDGYWRFPAKGTSRSRSEVLLSGHGYQEVRLAVPVPHQALIERWTMGPLTPDSILSLSTINQFVARTDGRCELMADLLGRDGRPVAQGLASWWVDGELPLSTIRDDVASLLRPLGDIRARIKLNFNDSHDNFWYISEFEHELRDEGRGYLPHPALVEEQVVIVGRALHNASQERDDFGPYGLLDCVNHRPFELPPLQGNWLIYLRSNERVLSCPYFVRGGELAVLPSTRLAKAMAVGDWHERKSALGALCDELFADPDSERGRETIRSIIDLALSLEGLPPSTFDIFALMCERPLLGTLMLMTAQRAEMEPILRLSEGLPFEWCLIPKPHWERAAKAQADFLFRSISDELVLIAKSISDRRREIVEVEPVLSDLVDMAGASIALDVAANAFLTRSSDRIQTSISNPFRPELESNLPRWKVGEHFWRALDAPVAAALAAKDKVQLDRAQIYCIKDISRRHPRWFREAFSAAYQEK